MHRKDLLVINEIETIDDIKKEIRYKIFKRRYIKELIKTTTKLYKESYVSSNKNNSEFFYAKLKVLQSAL